MDSHLHCLEHRVFYTTRRPVILFACPESCISIDLLVMMYRKSQSYYSGSTGSTRVRMLYKHVKGSVCSEDLDANRDILDDIREGVVDLSKNKWLGFNGKVAFEHMLRDRLLYHTYDSAVP